MADDVTDIPRGIKVMAKKAAALLPAAALAVGVTAGGAAPRDLNYATFLIEGKDAAGVSLTGGTAVIYNDGRREYLITCRHLVAPGEGGAVAKLLVHGRAPTPAGVGDWRRTLAVRDGNGVPIWLEHPTYGDKVDLVAIPLPEHWTAGCKYEPMYAGDILAKDENALSYGIRLVIPGYPLGFHEKNAPRSPISRNGLVATTYGHDYDGLPCFLVDAPLFGGNSGSPVFLVLNAPVTTGGETTTLTAGGKDFYFLGINSEGYAKELRKIAVSRSVSESAGLTEDVIAVLRKQGEEAGVAVDDDTAAYVGLAVEYLLGVGYPVGLNTVWYASLIPEVVNQ